MSKTIEERAEEYADKADNILEYSDGWQEHSDYCYVKKAYIHGATDQESITKKEMVEKACKAFCDHICDLCIGYGCCYKYDDRGRVRDTFEYNECNPLQVIRRVMEE